MLLTVLLVIVSLEALKLHVFLFDRNACKAKHSTSQCHENSFVIDSSSAMAERSCELDQRFQMGGGSIRGYYRLRSYFSRHCDTTQFTLRHHMVNKPFLLLGLGAEYRSRRHRRWCANSIAADHQMFITLTCQLSWQRLRRSAVDLYSKAKKSLFEPPFRALRDNVRTPSIRP